MIGYGLIQSAAPSFLARGGAFPHGGTAQRWALILKEEIKTAEVALNATLTRKSVSLRDVMEFKAGTVLPIDLPSSIVARVEDVPVFRGVYGAHQGKQALKVIETIRHSDFMSQTVSLGAIK